MGRDDNVVTKRTKNISKSDYIEAEKMFTELCDNGELGYWPPLSFKNVNSIRERLNKSEFPSEKWFEAKLRANGIRGFLRNWPIANRFFADFYFYRGSIAVEIDGNKHDRLMDKGRDRIFKKYGIKTIRIDTGDEIKMASVVSDLKKNPRCKLGFKLQRKKPSDKDLFNYFPLECKPVAPTPHLFIPKAPSGILIKKADAVAEPPMFVRRKIQRYVNFSRRLPKHKVDDFLKECFGRLGLTVEQAKLIVGT